MCVDDDSYPPIPPIAGGATDTRDLRLTSADGTRFMAFGARAAAPTGAGMIVIPDVRGLHRYYKDLATRFAEVGVDAVAFDFFARTASPLKRTSENSVSANPGSTVHTRIPVPHNSRRNVRVICNSPALAAEYAEPPS